MRGEDKAKERDKGGQEGQTVESSETSPGETGDEETWIRLVHLSKQLLGTSQSKL